MKISTMVLTILVAALTAFAVVRYTPQPVAMATATTNKVYDRIKKNKEIRCSYVIYPPLFDKDPETGAFSGVMFDLVETLGKQMGVKIVWAEETGTDNAFAGLQTERYDAVCPGFWINAQRAAVSNFAMPFYYQGMYVFARADDTRFDAGPQTLNSPDVTIDTMEGEMSQIIAREIFPKAKTLTQHGLSGESSRLMDVAAGKADVTMNELPVYQQYNKANPGKIKLLYAEPVRIYAGAIGFPKGEHDLLKEVDANIALMNALGITDQILSKYDPEGREYIRLAVPYRLPPK